MSESHHLSLSLIMCVVFILSIYFVCICLIISSWVWVSNKIHKTLFETAGSPRRWVKTRKKKHTNTYTYTIKNYAWRSLSEVRLVIIFPFQFFFYFFLFNVIILVSSWLFFFFFCCDFVYGLKLKNLFSLKVNYKWGCIRVEKTKAWFCRRVMTDRT